MLLGLDHYTEISDFNFLILESIYVCSQRSRTLVRGKRLHFILPPYFLIPLMEVKYI